MCGGTVKDIQKAADKGIKDFQKQADAALGQATDGALGTDLSKQNASGKSSPSLNLNQDFTKIDVAKGVETTFKDAEQSLAATELGGDRILPEIPMPDLAKQWAPNLDQDWSQLNPEKLQQAAITEGSKLQSQVVEIGSAIQAGATAAGSALQQNLIQAGTDLQAGAIYYGSKTGQSNPIIEAELAKAIKATETNIQSIADWAKANEQGFTQSVENNVEGLTKSIETNVEGITSTFEDIVAMFTPANDKKWKGPDGTEAQPLPEVPTLDDNKPFEDIETATTKADQMTEEERLRRIRRLMLNRYGREDTILTGTADTTGRRRTAPGFMGM